MFITILYIMYSLDEVPHNYSFSLYLLTVVIVADNVYFSNNEDIEVLVNNKSRVVFEELHIAYVVAVDCNSNPSDHRIYWMNTLEEGGSSGVIKKGFPDNSSSAETVSTYIIILLCSEIWSICFACLYTTLKILNFFCKFRYECVCTM